MGYLLDTHAFLWFLNGDNQLSSKAKKCIEDTSQTNFISIASIWEISIKLNLNKLKLAFSLEELKNEIVKNNFEILPLDFEHIIQLSTLENHHRDPFDRILISQAIAENLQIITKDSNFIFYNQIEIVW